MLKNYTLCALAVLFALLGLQMHADAFDPVRPWEERELPGGEQRTVAPGLVEVETRGSGRKIEVKPVESLIGEDGIVSNMFGGGNREPRYNGRYYR